MKAFLALITLVNELFEAYSEYRREQELRDRIQAEMDSKRILVRQTANELEKSIVAFDVLPDYMHKYKRD